MPPGATKENSKAAVGYDYCSKLFAAERKYAHLSSSVRKTARQVEAEPLLEAYWWWVNTLEPTLGSKLAEAVTYAKNQKEYLNSFLEHGEVDISNNYAENALFGQDSEPGGSDAVSPVVQDHAGCLHGAENKHQCTEGSLTRSLGCLLSRTVIKRLRKGNHLCAVLCALLLIYRRLSVRYRGGSFLPDFCFPATFYVVGKFF